MENKELRQIVSNLFKENEIHHNFNVSNGIVDVSVEWGDWKHEHLFLRNLMRKNNFALMDEHITEEDGSDCYSAEHRYMYLG